MIDSPAIEVHDLSKTYREGWLGRRSVTALRGVALEVKRGEIFGLLGPNGAGKTTLIKILLGIVHFDKGGASLLGSRAGDRVGRQLVGYLPENHRIPRHHTGNSALLYYGSLSGLSRREIRRRLAASLELVGLEKWGRMAVRKYSKGMLQRLGLAQAMLHDPELLILDEPTDGVDPVGRSEMRTLMQQLKSRGKTVFLNSHLLQELELVCDRVAILDQGEVLREGSLADITVPDVDEIQFVVGGSEEKIREALAGRTIHSLYVIGLDQYEVSLPATDQAEIDRAVDDLRHGGLSVISMSRRRRTLEEAFLEILKQARGQS